MLKRTIAIVGLLTISSLLNAHEFWLLSNKFFFQPGESASIGCRIGENFVGEAWNLNKNRIEQLTLHQQENVTDLKSQVKEGDKENLNLLLPDEGTSMIVMQSNNAFIKLDAEKFNAYLKEDGLDEAYYQREKTKTLGDSAKELYSRHTKLLLQVGSKTDDTFKKVIGLPIEIVPEKNPYAVKVGEHIRFKILFKNSPVFGARVKVWNRYKNQTSLQNIYSQQDGTIEVPLSHPGMWMVSVVQMVPSKDTKANWQSYWGSLVFGVQ